MQLIRSLFADKRWLFHLWAGLALPVSAIWPNHKQIQLHWPEQKIVHQDFHYYLKDLQSNEKVELETLSQKNKITTLSTQNISIDEWITRPLALIVTDSQNEVKYQTWIQWAGLLDELYTYGGNDLGLTFVQGTPQFKLWSPVAKKVDLVIYKSVRSQDSEVILPMQKKGGVWELVGYPQWHSKFYVYRLYVFNPEKGQMDTIEVTDPYSVSLSMNSDRSQIIDLNSEKYQPKDWKNLKKPEIHQFSDISIMEVHIRDLTARDPGVPAQQRGTFSALSEPNSQAQLWLKNLVDAGLTHVHFLPFSDFATVNEDRSTWLESGHQPTDEWLEKIKDQDSYNWGYDPFHYFTPEGSYSQQPDGPQRILELREMIQTLNQIGLRVIMDVVLNHTYQLKPLDSIVPFYFYRMDQSGKVQTSSCCYDLASEHAMVEKLMIDFIRFWSIQYKLDGFRFDLMNLHTVENMQKIKNTIRQLRIQKEGVDGSKIFLYGEAWPFGSLEDKLPGSAFWQLRSAGRGIATFNDRMRDAVRGGTPHSNEKSDQGFATGLFYDFNHEPANRNTPIPVDQQREKVLHLGDVVKIGLAGNLAKYRVRDFLNHSILSENLLFRGAPTGYAGLPEETINYVSSHDGYSLWDTVQAKLPLKTANAKDRVRTHRLMLAITALSQGIPFFEGGSDLLRSKSGDVDSYNSGDWFNQIDFTFHSNNWNSLLPPSWRNINDWSFWKPRLSKPELKITTDDILSTHKYFKSLLKVRKSNPLFRLSQLGEIQRYVQFPFDARVGGDIPGLIIMQLSDELYVFFNATPFLQGVVLPSTKNCTLRIHPELDDKVDPDLKMVKFNEYTGEFQIPGRSTVVFQSESCRN